MLTDGGQQIDNLPVASIILRHTPTRSDPLGNHAVKFSPALGRLPWSKVNVLAADSYDGLAGWFMVRIAIGGYCAVSEFWYCDAPEPEKR